MSSIHFLGHMNRDEVAAVAGSAIVLIPIGSTEQHGTHPPLLTDSIIVESISHRAMELIDNASPIVHTPVLSIGSSHHHLFACALSLRTDTYINVLRDICTTLVRSGFRRLFFVNGHGGNDLPMRLVCNELVLDMDATVAACSYWTLTPAQTNGPANAIDHAGHYETSLMMHLAPDLVGTPAPELGDTTAIFDTVLSQGLLVNRKGEWPRIGGVTTRADKASAELGGRIVEDRAAALAEALRRFDLASRDKE
jgi:creatinine amidohydrolase